VIPEHFLIFPKTHNGILIDWSYAVKPGISIMAISPSRREFYPVEVFAKRPAQFGTDLFMAAMCLLYLVGGETTSQTFPKHIPVPMRGLLRTCLLGPAHRPHDVYQLFIDFGELLKALYGAKKFRQFVMPESASITK
jgi:hypothetical protein